jgi:hypothetical protein
MATKNVPDDDRGDANDRCRDYDLLATKLAQLQSMLMMTYGGARETFDSMNDDLRDSYLWACADMVDECIGLNDMVGFVVRPGQAEVSHA